MSAQDFYKAIGYEDGELYADYVNALKNGKKAGIMQTTDDGGKPIMQLYIN